MGSHVTMMFFVVSLVFSFYFWKLHLTFKKVLLICGGYPVEQNRQSFIKLFTELIFCHIPKSMGKSYCFLLRKPFAKLTLCRPTEIHHHCTTVLSYPLFKRDVYRREILYLDVYFSDHKIHSRSVGSYNTFLQ